MRKPKPPNHLNPDGTETPNPEISLLKSRSLKPNSFITVTFKSAAPNPQTPLPGKAQPLQTMEAHAAAASRLFPLQHSTVDFPSFAHMGSPFWFWAYGSRSGKLLLESSSCGRALYFAARSLSKCLRNRLRERVCLSLVQTLNPKPESSRPINTYHYYWAWPPLRGWFQDCLAPNLWSQFRSHSSVPNGYPTRRGDVGIEAVDCRSALRLGL